MATAHRTKRLRTGIAVHSIAHDARLLDTDYDNENGDIEGGEGGRVRRRRLDSISAGQDLATILPAEVALQVFDKLSPADLGRCAVVSRLWYGLVNDQQLWKRLFHWKFTNSRIMRIGMDRQAAASKRRRSISTSTLEWVARSLEEEEELPSYATCWKALYKLNYNWLMGQPVVTCLSLEDIQRHDRLQHTETILPAGKQVPEGQSIFSMPLVQFMGSFLATATNTPWGSMVHFWRLVRSGATNEGNSKESSVEDDTHRLRIEYWQTFVCPKPPPSFTASGGACQQRKIVSFEFDRSLTRGKSLQPHQLAMLGYDTGEFTIIEIDTSPPSSTASTISNMPAATRAIREIGTWSIDAVDDKASTLRSTCFHYPLIATYCANGTFSIFKVLSAATENGVSSANTSTWCRLLHRMHGRIGESPVEMEVEEVAQQPGQKQQPVGSRWLVRLAFGVPLFDGSWTVRLQEIEIDDHRIIDCVEVGSGNYHHDHHRHHSRKPAFADWAHSSSSDPQHQDIEMEVDEDDGDESLLGSHTLATVAPIASINLTSPYLVTTHRDNTMNVFRIRRRRWHWPSPSLESTSADILEASSSAASIARGRLEFWHMSTLYGHCGAVSSASIDARLGRLVSASMDRSVKIWRIGKGDGNEEAATTTSMHQYYHHPHHQHTPVPRGLSDATVAAEEDEDLETSWPPVLGDEQDDYDPDCLVSMSVNDNSWARSKQINRDEGVGLVWIGSDDEKIVSVSVDGMVRVWRFT